MVAADGTALASFEALLCSDANFEINVFGSDEDFELLLSVDNMSLVMKRFERRRGADIAEVIEGKHSLQFDAEKEGWNVREENGKTEKIEAGRGRAGTVDAFGSSVGMEPTLNNATNSNKRER